MTESVFELLDFTFTILFTMELAMNMFATFLWEFLGDSWNYFDVVVVSISVTGLVVGTFPGANVLRTFRCFRVFRLFKRIKSLRVFTQSLSRSVGRLP